ncbi:Male-specific lethal 1-like 1 [Chionoecetes opilio]|uniref:Male-specific lethal 1-like 1 n=1 Tax=Chionoecetes opilio TaxID=41210 RepID=A0A8J4YNS5_CHIOP|nr:Male-specific lethal 1-like 1 [Chionoecetes opilio]
MPRRVGVYNGDHAVKEARVAVRRQEQVRRGRGGRGLSPMTTTETTENKLAMAVELDHMYIGCSDSKASIEKDIEVQHLKNIILLHLDLIQQQADELLAKERQIKNLRDENDNSRLPSSPRHNTRISNSSVMEGLMEDGGEEVLLDYRWARLQTLIHDNCRTFTDKFNIFETLIQNIATDCQELTTDLFTLRARVKDSLIQQKQRASEAYTNTETQVDALLSPKQDHDIEVFAFEDEEPHAGTLASPHRRTPPTPTPNRAASAATTRSPHSKPVSPSTNAVSPSLKVPSPSSTKSLSPPGKNVSPGGKTCSPASKTGSPASKPSSPSSHNESPSRIGDSGNKVMLPIIPLDPLEIRADFCFPSKPGSPPHRILSPKQLSPTSKAVSPANRGSYLSNRVHSPPSKPGSPANRPPGEPASPPHKVISPVSRLAPSQNKMGNTSVLGRPESLRRTSPKITSPKTSPRERYPRGEANDCSLTDSECLGESLPDPLRKESPRSGERRYGPKRRLESEGEGEAVIKRTRSDSDCTDPNSHNLRSRDRPKERAKEPPAQGSPVPALERPCTPTSRAAALETKKLRQKLLLKGQLPAGRAVRGEGILNTSVAYYLPYGSLRHDPNPEEECLQSQVEIPQWGTRVLTSLYVMEGTENLEDEVFLKRHAKPEQDEKRRKRWDLQRMREQRHYERLRERYEGRQNPCEPEVTAGYRSLWPYPESALYLHVDDYLPVCAFGQPMARIPPQ